MKAVAARKIIVDKYVTAGVGGIVMGVGYARVAGKATA
jgi:hypothetical protein